MSDEIPLSRFSIPDPDKYHCKVLSYTLSHKDLTVEVKHTQDFSNYFYLIFGGVFYFSGLMSWRGVSIYIAPHNELLSFMEQSKQLMPFLDEARSMSHSIKFFRIGLGETQVEIISGDGLKCDDLV